MAPQRELRSGRVRDLARTTQATAGRERRETGCLQSRTLPGRPRGSSVRPQNPEIVVLRYLSRAKIAEEYDRARDIFVSSVAGLRLAQVEFDLDWSRPRFRRE